MSDTKFNLDLIEVPTPCPVPWESMQGDDRVHHCGQCRKHVYHLSNMTRAEAEALVMAAEGEMCAQFYRRADGTVVTKDCMGTPVPPTLVSALTFVGLSALALFGIHSVIGSPNTNSTFSFIGGGLGPPRGSYKSESSGPNAPAAPENEQKPHPKTEICGPMPE